MTRTVSVLFLAVLAAVVAVKAQEPLRVDVDLVMVNVTITDRDNQLVTDLQPEHFQVWEDRVEQEIQYFSTEDAPMSLGIVFDFSHSMQRKLDVAREAAATFLQMGSPEDEYFLVEFSNRAQIAHDFTSDINRLRDALALRPAEGNTALFDAVYLGLTKVKEGQNAKKALLLITDGEDNRSRYSRRDLREFVRESDVQIFIIDLGRALINDLAEMTGGKAYRASLRDLADVCEQIALEIKSQYVIGYASTNPGRDGQWRRIQVRAMPPPGMSRVNVRAKTGYYAPRG